MRAMALVVVLVAAQAMAADDSACVADGKKLCSNIPPGDGRILTCLRARYGELSSGCQSEFQRQDARVANMTAACSSDIWLNCQGVVAGQGRVYSCLIYAWDKVSSGCRDKLNSLYATAQAVTTDCEADGQRLCSDQSTPVGKLYLCLKWHEAEVSSRCKAALKK